MLNLPILLVTLAIEIARLAQMILEWLPPLGVM